MSASSHLASDNALHFFDGCPPIEDLVDTAAVQGLESLGGCRRADRRRRLFFGNKSAKTFGDL